MTIEELEREQARLERRFRNGSTVVVDRLLWVDEQLACRKAAAASFERMRAEELADEARMWRQ